MDDISPSVNIGVRLWHWEFKTLSLKPSNISLFISQSFQYRKVFRSFQTFSCPHWCSFHFPWHPKNQRELTEWRLIIQWGLFVDYIRCFHYIHLYVRYHICVMVNLADGRVVSVIGAHPMSLESTFWCSTISDHSMYKQVGVISTRRRLWPSTPTAFPLFLVVLHWMGCKQSLRIKDDWLWTKTWPALWFGLFTPSPNSRRVSLVEHSLELECALLFSTWMIPLLDEMYSPMLVVKACSWECGSA